MHRSVLAFPPVQVLDEVVDAVVGDQGGDLDDGATGRVESCHLQVHPDQHEATLRVWPRADHSPLGGPRPPCAIDDDPLGPCPALAVRANHRGGDVIERVEYYGNEPAGGSAITMTTAG